MSKEPIPFNISEYINLDEKHNLVLDGKDEKDIQKTKMLLDFIKIFCSDTFTILSTKQKKQDLFVEFDKFVSMETNLPTANIVVVFDRRMGGVFLPGKKDTIFIKLHSNDKYSVTEGFITYLHEKYHQYLEEIYRKAIRVIDEESKIAKENISKEKREKGIMDIPPFLLFDEGDSVDHIVYEHGMKLRQNVLDRFKRENEFEEKEFEDLMAAHCVTHDISDLTKSGTDTSIRIPCIQNILEVNERVDYARADEVLAHRYQYKCEKELKDILKYLKKNAKLEMGDRAKARSYKRGLSHGCIRLADVTASTCQILGSLEDEFAGETEYLTSQVKEYVHDREYKKYVKEVDEYWERKK